jgi:uncharacterized cupredoxin-like copper-binding protein
MHPISTRHFALNWANGHFFAILALLLQAKNGRICREEDHMKKTLILIASALILTGNWTKAFAGEGGGEGIGGPGDPAKVSRSIEIVMVENRFKPSEINVKQGETIKFVLRNSGKKKHEMMIGTPDEIDEHGKIMKKHPDAEHHDEPNMISVNSGETRELIWRFSDAGTVYYACPLPGHFKGMNFPGMKGTINVEPK